MKLGLVGKGIQYSYSPTIHNFWLDYYQIEGEYQLFDCPEEDLIRILKEGELTGLNVTIPYKTKILEFLGELSIPYGAVNTLRFEGDGAISAINSDFLTAHEIFQQVCPKTALVLGAGGAAQAVVAALSENQVADIKVCSRRKTAIDGVWYPWDERIPLMQQCDIVINATSLKDRTLLGEKPFIPKSVVIVDLAYDKTVPFLTEWAHRHDREVITGKEFLLRQAQYSFHFWTGIFPDVPSKLKQVIL
jgi:shikimate dehydrogenase